MIFPDFSNGVLGEEPNELQKLWEKTFVNRREVEPIRPHEFFSPNYNRLFRDSGFCKEQRTARHFLTIGLKKVHKFWKNF